MLTMARPRGIADKQPLAAAQECGTFGEALALVMRWVSRGPPPGVSRASGAGPASPRPVLGAAWPRAASESFDFPERDSCGLTARPRLTGQARKNPAGNAVATLSVDTYPE